VYDESGVLDVSYHKYIKREVDKIKLVFDDEILYDKKYLNRDNIDMLFENRGECDEILIVKNGKVTDTSIANIAFFDSKKWVTPKEPLLCGTTRERLLKNSFLVEDEIFVDDIFKYKKVALLNAMIDFDIIATKDIKDIFC